jgi:hypothetical protein
MPIFQTPARGALGDLQADNMKNFVLKKAGAQTAVALAATEIWYNDTDMPMNIWAVRTTLGTAPTGSTFITDLLVNGTSIYTGVTANRPTIAISGTTALGGTPATTAIPVGGSVTATVIQIGSGTAGSDLAVQVTLYS